MIDRPEQHPEAFRSGRLGANLSLEAVQLRRVEFAVLGEWRGGTEYVVDTSLGFSWERRGDDCVAYELDFALTVHPGDEDDALLSGLGQFELTYACPSDLEFEEDEAEAFADVSVVLSAYPFVRELVQSLTTRAGMPPLTLGSLRRGLQTEQDGSSTAEDS